MYVYDAVRVARGQDRDEGGSKCDSRFLYLETGKVVIKLSSSAADSAWGS